MQTPLTFLVSKIGLTTLLAHLTGFYLSRCPFLKMYELTGYALGDKKHLNLKIIHFEKKVQKLKNSIFTSHDYFTQF